MTTCPYAQLRQLADVQLPVYARNGVEERARGLATRFERAYRFLTNTLQTTPDVQLALLSAQDWPQYTGSPYYGAVLYDYPNRTVVAGGEPSSFSLISSRS